MEYPSYYVQLNPLDNYYKKYSRKVVENADVMPIWDFNSRNDEYRNFEISVYKKKTDDFNDSVSESSGDSHDATKDYPTYKCKMCNINVPTTYKTEHNSSPKHRICVELADIVLERIRSFVTEEKEDITAIKPTSTYFCEPCSVIVHNKNRNVHERSKYHYKSLLHDRFLKDLQMIYKHKDYLNDIDLDYLLSNKVCDDGEDISNSCSDSEGLDVEGEDGIGERGDRLMKSPLKNRVGGKESKNLNYAKSLSSGADTVANGVIESSWETSSMSPNEVDEPAPIETGKVPRKRKRRKKSNKIECNNTSNLELDEDQMKEYYKRLTENTNYVCKFTFDGPDRVNIVRADKCVLQVSFDNFNGIFRKFDNGNGGTAYTQCRVCRTMIKTTVAEHISSLSHIEKMRIPLEGIHSFRQMDRYKHCVLCNEYFLDIECHKLMESHQRALQTSLTFKQDELHTLNPIKLDTLTSDTHTSLPVNAPSVSTCTVQNKPNALNHKTVHPSMVAIQMPKAVRGKTYCRPCNKYVDSHNYHSHAAGKYHKIYVREFTDRGEVEDTPEVTPDPFYHLEELSDKSVKCKICNTKVPSALKNLQEHVMGSNHLNKIDEILKVNKVAKVSKNSFKCNVCDVIINRGDELTHIKSAKHKESFEQSKTHIIY